MSALPSGWESDYDGSRWFYRYKPTGQVQFRFPQDGDEFPDFVDAYAPAPDLAPEEKLESQQQVKRNTTAPDSNNEKAAGNPMMRATAGPLGGGLGFSNGASRGSAKKQENDPIDDEDDGAAFYYQPESFMFLGPGAYNDVSPLADEDDRVDAGAKPPEKGKQNAGVGNQAKPEDVKQSHLSSKVSPIQSESTTPLVIHSTPVADETAAVQLSIETQNAPAVEPPAVESPAVPMLDSREMPHELPAVSSWNPIGVVAEMPTEHTAQARIETHPEPVEIGDSTVLAPIETRMAEMHVGIAELAEHTSPIERKPVDTSEHDGLQQTSLPEHVLYQATFGTRARPQNASPPSSAQNTPGTSTPVSVPKGSPERVPKTVEEPIAPRSESPFKIARKPTNAGSTGSKYQPYAPGAATATIRWPQSEEPVINSSPRDHRVSLIREGSLMLGPREPAKVQPNDIPAVLQPPRLPPKVSAEDSLSQSTQPPAGYYPVPHHIAFAARQHAVPSAKDNGQSPERVAEGSLSHVPSVLKPARGRIASQDQRELRGGGVDNPPQLGQIHHASTMDVNQQPALGPRPGVQRVSTAPATQPMHPQSGFNMPQPETMNTPPPTLRDSRSYEPSPNGDWSIDSQPYRHQVTSPPQGRLPRQQSFPASEVSSLGPSSSRQSSIGQLQTPSPPESLQRTASNLSGFFAIGGGGGGQITNPNRASVSDQSLEPFPAYSTPTREPGTRPASFSGPSSPLASASQDMGGNSRPMPPVIPKKIPLEPGPNEAGSSHTAPTAHMPRPPQQMQWPAGQQLPNAAPPMKQLTRGPQRQGTARRHSLPQEQTTPPTQHLDLVAGTQRLGGEAGLQRSSAQLQGEKVPSAPFHWTYPALDPSSSSRSQSHDLGNQSRGSSASTPAVVEPRQSADRPVRPTVGTTAQQPSRPSVSTPVQSPGHALLPIQEHPETDQGRSSSQPAVPVYKQNPALFVRPGQLDRAATTLPVVQQPPPPARPPAFATAERHQNAPMLPSPQPTPTQYPHAVQQVQPLRHPLQQQEQPQQQHPQPQLQPPPQPMGNQQYMTAPPPLQHHQRSYSSPLGTVGPVIEKEKEKGGWFSKFKKGSHKSAVLQKLPPHAVQVQQASFAQQQQQGPHVQRHSDEMLYRQQPQQPQQQQPQQPQQQYQQPTAPQQQVTNGHINQQVPYQGQGLAQPPPQWVPGAHSTGPPAEMRAPETLAFPVRSSSDTIREVSPVIPAVQPANTTYAQPVTVAAPDLTRTLSSANVPHLDRQASTASSYAASISTVDISEAYAQPIMKPQLITVQRAATAPVQPPAQSQSSAVPGLVWSEQSHGYVPAQQVQQQVQPPQVSYQPAPTGQLAPAPYIASSSQSMGVAGPSTQTLPQRGNSKWTKRPAADYSGGDWGEDDWGN